MSGLTFFLAFVLLVHAYAATDGIGFSSFGARSFSIAEGDNSGNNNFSIAEGDNSGNKNFSIAEGDKSGNNNFSIAEGDNSGNNNFSIAEGDNSARPVFLNNATSCNFVVRFISLFVSAVACFEDLDASESG